MFWNAMNTIWLFLKMPVSVWHKFRGHYSSSTISQNLIKCYILFHCNINGCKLDFDSNHSTEGAVLLRFLKMFIMEKSWFLLQALACIFYLRDTWFNLCACSSLVGTVMLFVHCFLWWTDFDFYCMKSHVI